MKSPTGSLALRERLGLIAVLVGLAAVLVQSDWLWRVDQLLYDAQMRLWSRPAPDDIVIVAIDEASLAALGRWPWRRELHAKLLDRLTAEQPRAVAIDIIFAEPNISSPEADQLLVEAVKHNGRVVLPVLMEQTHAGGQPVETLPLPSIAEVVAGIGHVHVEVDQDGIVRRLYLREGLGDAFWPHLTLAALEVGGQLPAHVAPRPVPSAQKSAMIWDREQQMLIPFAGPPGHFKRLSYAQVIEGEFLPGTFTDKYVLVGTTAAGLGDSLPTPVSGHHRSMPGVEINANALDALRSGIQIAPLSMTWRMPLTLGIALLPMLVLPLLAPRWSLISAAILIMSVFVFSGALLWLGHVWFPPAAALLVVALSYPLWSWRRLELAMRYLNNELDELTREQARLAIAHPVDLRDSMAFLADFLPISGWALHDAAGHLLEATGQAPTLPVETLQGSNWLLTGDALWRRIRKGRQDVLLGVNWAGDELPDASERALLDALPKVFSTPDAPHVSAYELLQNRITQVQDATRQLQGMREFVDNSLSNMSDGVLVTDALGNILIANTRAGWYLRGDDHAQLVGYSMRPLLQELSIRDGGEWSALLQIVLLQHTRVQAAVRHRTGRDLLVQIAPLSTDADRNDGLILNFSDISPLTASERKRDELLNFLSHDLRSPLVSLLALFQIAKKKETVAEVRAEMDRMTGYTEKTLNLAEQFLQLARAEGSQDLPFYEVDLINVIWNACEQVWVQAREKHIEVNTAIELDEAWVMGEGTLLERALINLLSNAIKYSEPESRVDVSLVREGKYLRCCVQDYGMGIPAGELPRLFDRFQRVHRGARRDETGAGLGLAFVDAAIKRHSGQVEVQSVEGEGSRFCLLLLAVDEREQEH